MLISYRKNNNEGFDETYIQARRKLDLLCGIIISGRISRDSAERIYEEIKSDYLDSSPDNAELFRMIYDNRIARLCDQFYPGRFDEE